ncbi:hypothetical protein FGIG_10858, partial [Fasciola gigantica]
VTVFSYKVTKWLRQYWSDRDGSQSRINRIDTSYSTPIFDYSVSACCSDFIVLLFCYAWFHVSPWRLVVSQYALPISQGCRRDYHGVMVIRSVDVYHITIRYECLAAVGVGNRAVAT